MSKQETTVTGLKTCPSFGRCSAPLCPLDAGSLAGGIWFPDEPICCAQGRGERWIGIQKRIAKKTNDRRRGYFTVEMLSVVAAVGRAIRGISPDTGSAEAEARWIAGKRRPERVRRPPTENQLRARAEFSKNAVLIARKGSIRTAENMSASGHDIPVLAEGSLSTGRSGCGAADVPKDSRAVAEEAKG